MRKKLSNIFAVAPIIYMMAAIPTEYPRGPYKRFHYDSLERLEARHHPQIALIGPVVGTASDGLDRIGAGAAISIPLSDAYNLGVGYLNYPFKTERIMSGHRVEIYLGLPEKLRWGEWRFGIFADLSSLDSMEDIKKNGGLSGAFAGLSLPIFTFLKHGSAGLWLEGGAGYVFESQRFGTILLGGTEVKWMF